MTLLVRAHEVVAVVGHDSQHLFAMQNEVPEDHGKGSDSYLQALLSKFYYHYNPQQEEARVSTLPRGPKKSVRDGQTWHIPLQSHFQFKLGLSDYQVSTLVFLLRVLSFN
jgi:hypothetical protein